LHYLAGFNRPVICASFNHHLRPESDEDIAHVQAVTETLGLPFVTDSADVAAHAAAEGLSVEEAARILRYRFLFREARKARAQAVAVGHTADDQAETVLMHFLRGAGLSGLKGMPPRVILPVFDAEIPLIRPLLTWTRADTEAYCRENSLPTRHDASNDDKTYLRNRLRHELLPLLESYNPQIRQSLARTAQALQGDHEILAKVIDEAWESALVDQGKGYLAFDRVVLNYHSEPMRRNIFRRAIQTLSPNLRDADFDVLARAASFKSGIIDLAGGLQIFNEGQVLYVACADARFPPLYWPQLENPFELQSGFAPLGSDWVLRVDEVSGEEAFARAQENQDPFTAWLAVSLTEDPLWLRNFRTGDRFEPLGMPGKQVKLSDLFVNLKIPKRARPKWPLLCIGDEIAWVVGLRLAHRWRVTDQTRQALCLRLIKI
jgi:tRNA(Ile)-lysidine synthase